MLSNITQSIIDFLNLVNTVNFRGWFYVVLAIVVLFLGRSLARRSRTWYLEMVVKFDITINKSLVGLGEAILYYGIWILAISFSLAILGVPIISILVILFAIAIIIAITLQSSLANFGAMIVIEVFKIFKAGDWVEIMDAYGQVQSIEMFGTVIITYDKRTVTIPNAQILKNEIVNYSDLGIRRIELYLFLSHDEDLIRAKTIIEDVIAQDELVLKEPEAVVGVLDLANGRVQLTVWPFVKVTDYWPVRFRLMETIKLRLDDAGIKIPYPQRDVHLFNDHSISST